MKVSKVWGTGTPDDGGTLRQAPYPVLVLGPSGEVLEASAGARSLFPALGGDSPHAAPDSPHAAPDSPAGALLPPARPVPVAGIRSAALPSLPDRPGNVVGAVDFPHPAGSPGLDAMSGRPLAAADAVDTATAVDDPTAPRTQSAADAAPAQDTGDRGHPLGDTGGAWLLAAHRSFLADSPGPLPVRGVTAGQRSVEAHPTRRGDGAVVWWLVDDTERRSAERALAVERERTTMLVRASSRLLSSLNVERCMYVTAEEAVAHLADAAVVVAPRRGRRVSWVACVRGGTPESGSTTADPSRMPGLDEALRGFPPVPSRWIDPAGAPSWLVPPGFGPVGSLVITPLPGQGVPAGALVLLRRSGVAAFDEGEEVFARLFAARSGAAMSAAALYAEQTEITDTLMRELMPPRLEHVGGIEFAGGYRAAGPSERVGGDFYDVHAAGAPDGEALGVLGDVCGKGLEAAVLAGKIRNTLQALLPLADDHQRVLTLLNESLLSSHHTRFATMVLASARRVGDAVRLRLSSAGHPDPLIVRADGAVEAAGTRGTVVGVLPRVASATKDVTLAPGELCVLYTDGITEARGGPLGGEMFGEQRLRAALAECAGVPAEAAAERVRMLASEWTGGGRHDDMAVLVIGAPRGAYLTMVGGHGPGRYTA